MEVEVNLRFVKLDEPELKLIVTEAALSGEVERRVPVEPFTMELDIEGERRRVFFVRIVARREGGRIIVRDEPVIA